MASRRSTTRRRLGWPEKVGLVVGGVVALLVVALLASPHAAAAEPAWTWPLPPPTDVARAFDPPAHRYAAGHRGADLAGTPGAPVLAAGAGQVTYAGLLAGRGVVVVSHGELRTTYEPVTPSVTVGQAVTAGQALGTLDAGHAGCPAAACLHWGLRRGDTYLDPVQLVDSGPARLLPLPPADVAAGVAAAGPVPVGRPAAADRALRRAQTAAPAPVAEPDWSLRAAEAPSGAVAVLALAAGLTLLARPRHPPDDPATPGATPLAALDGVASAVPGVVAPVDLSVERLRRRSG